MIPAVPVGKSWPAPFCFRSNLAAEQSQHPARRKEIYESLHPATKKGGDRKSDPARNQNDNLALRSFVSDTAQKTGRPKRTIERLVKVANDLAPDVMEAVKASPLANGVRCLDVPRLYFCGPYEAKFRM